jgi:phage recombination protein Bet
MTTELARQTLSPERVDLLTRTIAKGASRDELALFVAICDRTGLDPFARQIYLVPRWDAKLGMEVRQPQVSIDGARLVAQRSGEYAGQTAVTWCAADGVWRDIWLSDEPPAAARVGCYRRGFAEPLYATALWREYCPRNNKTGQPLPMWSKMPSLMLAKCAEALALRKAFPAELSGLYTAEEMAQAETAPEAAPAPKAALAALPAPVEAPQSPAERKADLDALMSPTPVAAAAAAPEVTAEDQVWIPPDCAVAQVAGKKGGTVWRLDCPNGPQPIAVTDAKLASQLEANIAFRISSLVRIEVVGGKRIAREIIAEGRS